MARSVVVLSTFIIVVFFATTVATADTIGFEDRVRAQEAIERVYHAHRVGVTEPFSEVVTRELLEAKVRTYLEQTVALEKVWGERITGEALLEEWERIARETRFPSRLREIGDALDQDPRLLLECVARPALVSRLVGERYARDTRIHAGTRERAERVRALLRAGNTRAATEIARERRVRLERTAMADPGGRRSSARAGEVVELDSGSYRARRSRAPRAVGEVGAVVERAGAFEISVVVDEGPDHAVIARYSVPKQDRGAWWRAHRGTFSAGSSSPSVSLGPAELRRASEQALGFGGAFDPSCVPDDTWDNGILEDANPARDGHSAVWTGSEMIVWGGGGLDSGLRYDPLLDTFAPLSMEQAPTGRSFHTAVWTGTEMIVWGGWPLASAGGRYDPVQDSWTPLSTAGAPSARFDHTAVWTGHAMIVWGGTDGTVRLGSGGKYFPAADVWTAVTTSYAPGPRDRHTAVWTGSEMIVWGGMAPGPVAGGGRYDPIGDRWAPVTTSGDPAARADHLAVWTGTEMIVWGGTNGATLSNGSRYAPATDTWSTVSTSGAPVAGVGEVGVWTGAELVVWRGTDPGAQGRYSPAGNTWSGMAIGGPAPPAAGATAVWSGDEMIVWSPASGGRYDPQANDWASTATLPEVDGPSDRTGHTAVWTGSEMIVWGGPDLADPLGSRYDPLLETWTDVTTTGAPSARVSHAAVWTGSEMVVWGGVAGGVLQASGGRYDPIGDTWQATSAVGAPSARDGHAAVWTGSEMIVWGGFAGGDPGTQVGCESAHVADGAAYDPGADSWSPVSSSGAPDAREGHTAVWTGDEMLVWGGAYREWDADEATCVEGLEVADGARYDADLDAWTAIEPSGEPGAREGHTAVWTGSQMVVWGGETGSVMLATGGAYAPSTDTWTPTSPVGAPVARSGHTAVWTGSEMVVWGGGALLDSGGRYQPEWGVWRATTLAGAPAGRGGHRSVWTGDLMIVWGGSEPGGGRYAMGHSDIDGDGIGDGCLACPDGPADDSDGDGVACGVDNCPFATNADQLDDDGDGRGDACDPCPGDPANDPDNDRVCAVDDLCPGAWDPANADADGDGAGNACDDNDDGDAVPDASDNCPVDANDDQADFDLDGVGNVCDPCRLDSGNDVDGDGICAPFDNCPTDPNRNQRDADGDGAGDVCDPCPSDANDVQVGAGLCFAPQAVYPVNKRPASIAAGDFDGDGVVDFATANFVDNNLSLLPGVGQGLLGPAEPRPVRPSPAFIRAADLNSDGRSDILVVNTEWEPLGPVPGTVSVYIANASGFLPRKDYSVGVHPRALAVADFDQDGNPDVVVTGRESETLSFLKGTAFGNLYQATNYVTQLGRNPEGIVAGDFNNDQIADFSVSTYNPGTQLGANVIQNYIGLGNGTFAFAGELLVGGVGASIASHTVGDFNEDGNLDLVVGYTAPGGTDHFLAVYTGTGAATFVLGPTIPTGDVARSLAVGDFNQDDHADLTFVNTADWEASILTGDGDLGFGADVRLPVGVAPSSVTVADLNGDGRDSLGVANYAPDTVSVLRNRGPVGRSAPKADAGPNGIWLVPAQSPMGAVVHLDGSGSTDADSTPGTADDIVLYEWFRNLGQSGQEVLGIGREIDVLLPFYGNKIALRTTDRTGLSDIDFVTVTVVNPDTLPDLTLEFTPPTIWPPNHRMVDVQVTIVPGEDCPSPSAVLNGISSTEPDDVPGDQDGRTAVDIDGTTLGTPDLTFRVRAERSAFTSGRRYYVDYVVSCGNGYPKTFLSWFDVPFERDGTAEPLQIVLDQGESGTVLAWPAVPDAVGYDVIRGALDGIQETAESYELGPVTCIEADSADESTAGFEDATDPLPDEAFFYLVQYEEIGDSGYGTESAAKPRIPGGGGCL